MTNIVANYKTFLVKIVVLAIGKTDESWVQEGIDKYSKRLKHYISFEFVIIPDLKNRKNLSESQQKEHEGKLILKQVHNTDTLILLDEKGKEFDQGMAFKLTRFVYKAVRMLYCSFLFYFLPYLVLLIPYVSSATN